MNTEIYCNKYGKCALSSSTTDEIPFDEKIFIYEIQYLDKNIKLCIYGWIRLINIIIEIDEYTFRLTLYKKNFHTENTPDKVLDMIKIDGRIDITYSNEHFDTKNCVWTAKYKKIIDSHIADKIVSSLSEGVTIDKICDIIRCR